jgi:hypothetical protein
MDQRLIGGELVKQTPVNKHIARRRARVAVRPRTTSNKPKAVSTALPTLNIARIMTGISSFQTTIQSLSQSLQRLESIMGHTSKIFNFGRNVRFPSNRPFVPQLPKPPASKQEFNGEEIPIINLPKMQPSNNPLVRMFEYMDMNRMMRMFQTPMFQNILTQMFPVKQATPQAKVSNRRRRNVRKRVKPS